MTTTTFIHRPPFPSSPSRSTASAAGVAQTREDIEVSSQCVTTSSFQIGGQAAATQQQGANDERKQQQQQQLHKELAMNVIRRSVGLYKECPLATALLAGAAIRYVENRETTKNHQNSNLCIVLLCVCVFWDGELN
jgi:hypothetical protein